MAVRFTTIDLVWCVTLCAAGFGTLAATLRNGEQESFFSVLMLAGSAFIGAGIFAPFRQKALGACLGIGIPIPLIVIAFARAFLM